jgi:hypothetical protein
MIAPGLGAFHKQTIEAIEKMQTPVAELWKKDRTPLPAIQ